MKVVDTRKMFTISYLRYLKNEDEKFYGQDSCIIIDGVLYMPLEVATNLGYSILDKWIEEVNCD